MNEIKPIIGNATPTPPTRPDWNQEDEKKGDYIKNKPLKEIKAINSLKYYGDANIVPSDASLFGFTLSPYGGGAIESVNNTLPKNVVIPFEATVEGEILPITFLWDACFTSNDEVENFVIPNTVVEIGVSVFEGCNSLKSITIPKGVNAICYNAFNGCPLEEVYYTGTKAQWEAIEIGEGNDALLDAVIHYDHISTTKGYVDENITQINTELMRMIDSLHYYCNKDIEANVAINVFPVYDDQGQFFEDGIEMIQLANYNFASHTIVLPMGYEHLLHLVSATFNFKKQDGSAGDVNNITKVIAPRGVDYWDLTYLPNGFPDLEKIITITEDGVVEEHTV